MLTLLASVWQLRRNIEQMHYMLQLSLNYPELYTSTYNNV